MNDDTTDFELTEIYPDEIDMSAPSIDDDGDEEEEDLKKEPTGEVAPGEKLPRLRSALQQQMADQQQRMRDACDSEFWVAFCFQTRAQKEEFLTKTGILPALDEDKYVDGMEAAKILGVTLESRVPKWTEPKVSKRLVGLT